MKIADIINFLETVAPGSLQESYDNAGLLYGSPNHVCTGVIISLDITKEVLDEAKNSQSNLVISHHPLIFSGLKKLVNNQPVSELLIQAIKNDIAIYAIHTNLDNVITGVNGKIAALAGIEKTGILSPKTRILKKLYCFVPVDHLEKVRLALFESGAGHIGNYSECSFGSEGTGTFKAGENTQPFSGKKGQLHYEHEARLEVIFPAYLEKTVLEALKTSHPYEEVAFDIITLDNAFSNVGSGLIGQLPTPMEETVFLRKIQSAFQSRVIRHSPLRGKPIQKVALCGGAGSFLISNAIAAKADIFLTADLEYHDFFEAGDRIVLADIGHFESEQFTSDLLVGLLREKFPNFAVLKTGVYTNPVNYFL